MSSTHAFVRGCSSVCFSRSIHVWLVSLSCILPLVDGVGALTDGLVAVYSWDGEMTGLSPRGERFRARLHRHSRAFTAAFEEVVANEPVFEDGVFGRGIVVAPGCEHARKLAFRNWLPPAAAQITSWREHPAAYIPAGDATVSSVGPGGEAGAVEGEWWIRVQVRSPGSGLELAEPIDVIGGRYCLSLYARSLERTPLSGTLRLSDDEGTVMAAEEVTLSAQWQRLQLQGTVGTFTRNTKEQTHHRVRMNLTLSGTGEIAVDAVQLEMLKGYSYAGTATATTWIPGHGYRMADVLSLNGVEHVLTPRSGTIAFRFRLLGKRQAWRTLFEFPSGNRWEPWLQVHVRNDRQVALLQEEGAKGAERTDQSLQADHWYHGSIRWQGERADFFLDGEPLVSLAGVVLPEALPPPRLGSAGPNASANAVIDEVAAYRRALSNDEIARLAAMTTPVADLFNETVVIEPHRFLPTIAHTTTPQSWTCTVHNRAEMPLEGAHLVMQIGPEFTVEAAIPEVAANVSREVVLSFVADLALGSYPFRVSVRSRSGVLADMERQVSITPATVPYENLQVSPWGINASRAFGFTIGGGKVTDAMNDGLAWGPLKHYLGWPRTVDGSDWVIGMTGKPFRANFHDSGYMRRQLERESVRWARQFAGIPAMRSVTLNSEMQWLWQHDYSERRMDWVKQTFGLDLAQWFDPPDGNVDAHQTPFGRLKPSVADVDLPPDRVISADHPLYAYHRWFHGVDGPTESLLNQTLSDAIHGRRPDILTVQEPILRRCAVRAFDRMSIAQEWFYYENPMHAVMVQERLNAAVRGTEMRPTGMPQFLFKKGRAAPYAGIATGDMFREVVWLCALQPIRMLTYWNFNVVPNANFENYYSRCMTKAEIDELFETPTPDWEEAKAVIDKTPEARKLMPWTAELIETFTEVHTRQLAPLGALIPRWRNRQRRVAVIRSFASQIFREVRWPKTTWVENDAVYSGVPFDVLYDEDFERDGDVLRPYRLVILSRSVCLTRPVFEALVRFSSRGGCVVVDPETKVQIPGAIVLQRDSAGDAFERELAAREAELLARFGSVGHPQYVEAMAQSPTWPTRVDEAFASLLEEKAVPEARSLTPNTWLNLLEADGVCYVGVVNDLRTLGPMYGHFGKIREAGVPQTVVVRLDKSLGTVAYDVLEHRRLVLDGTRGGDGTWRCRLDVGACGARLLLLGHRAIGSMALDVDVAEATWGHRSGHVLTIQGTLLDEEGRPYPGLIPATVIILRPDGTESDFSRHLVFDGGRLSLRVPLPVNAPPGIWSVSLFDQASGKQQRAEVSWAGPP